MTDALLIEQAEVCYGRQVIPFVLSREKGVRLHITVHPDLRVTVKAPLGKSLDEVKTRVRRRGAWITKQKRFFHQFQPLQPPRRYVSGETHLYLGRQYRLKVVQHNTNSVKLKGRYLWVHVPDKGDSGLIRRLVEQWYRKHAVSIFHKRLDACLEKTKRLQIGSPMLRIRKMKTRWGSCTHAGVITLNTELVKTPLPCIDYAIMHELCHLRLHDHGPAFFRLLARCMPDWPKRKERLDLVQPL